jgi:ADP-heptose:LPS heptosyltransferase
MRLLFIRFSAIGDIVLASAFEKYVIAILGATSPALQVEPCMPVNTKARVFQAIVPNLTCQPCSNFGTKTCPKGHFNCMKQRDLPTIARQAGEMWGSE